ncbi:hypothetical protein E5288_WYG022758 [Bos mutus]|uniref:Reverse transcriptase domain-containing protein n=1 Tax=Bos mutus TaxID=72004 RepID=A0A6B0R0R6_9CETA|nr:hypothetical protein [Bos mutus]
MPSAYTLSQRHSPSLPLNGKIHLGAPSNSSSGLLHKGLRIPQPSLGKPWLLTWTHSIREYGCWLLQYMGDLLLAAETKEECWEGTKALLQLLMEAGYRVSKKKAQICKEEVSGDRISQQMELVAGIAPWSHHMRVKRTYHADPENAEWTAQTDPADH